MLSTHAFGALAALAVAFGASPAFANEAPAPAAATQVSVVTASAAATPATNGDAEYAQLFNSWKSLDSGLPHTGVIAAPAASASVPNGLPLARAILTSNYGMRTHPILGGARKHEGIDLAAPRGTPVYAPADGTVERASWFSSYGNFIEIDHGGSMETRYGHLSGYAVAAGDHVTKGQLIGYVGTTGRSTGPHLHYEVRVGGAAVDPTPYLADTQLALSNDPNLGRGGR
jgi:murein DD-endopeptidase MepM/ murein hydrolase activator NlpD